MGRGECRSIQSVPESRFDLIWFRVITVDRSK